MNGRPSGLRLAPVRSPFPSLPYICPAAPPSTNGLERRQFLEPCGKYGQKKQDVLKMQRIQNGSKILEGLQFKGKSRKQASCRQAGWPCRGSPMCALGAGSMKGIFGAGGPRNKEPIHGQGKRSPCKVWLYVFLGMRHIIFEAQQRQI